MVLVLRNSSDLNNIRRLGLRHSILILILDLIRSLLSQQAIYIHCFDITLIFLIMILRKLLAIAKVLRLCRTSRHSRSFSRVKVQLQELPLNFQFVLALCPLVEKIKASVREDFSSQSSLDLSFALK